MKNLKEMLVESSKNNELKKNVSLILKCEVTGINAIDSENTVNDFDDPHDFYVEDNTFWIDVDLNFFLFNKKEEIGKMTCYLNLTLNSDIDGVKLDSKQTSIKFNGDKMLCFDSDEVADLAVKAVYNDAEIWKQLHDVFEITDTDDIRKIFYTPELQKQIKYEISWVY